MIDKFAEIAAMVLVTVGLLAILAGALGGVIAIWSLIL